MGFCALRFGRWMKLGFFVSSVTVNRSGNGSSEGLTRWLWKTKWCDLFILLLHYVWNFVSKSRNILFSLIWQNQQEPRCQLSFLGGGLGNRVRMVTNSFEITKIWVCPGNSTLLLQLIAVHTLDMLWKENTGMGAGPAPSSIPACKPHGSQEFWGGSPAVCHLLPRGINICLNTKSTKMLLYTHIPNCNVSFLLFDALFSWLLVS